MAQAAYVLGLTSGTGIGGSAMDGNILRRTITMGAPQQVHSSWGRGVGVVAGVGGCDGWTPGCLNTSNVNSEISRLLLGCKKPKLRERLKPLGKTCCNTSHKKVAPLTVRSVSFLVPLSRNRYVTCPFSQRMMTRPAITPRYRSTGDKRHTSA